VWEAWASVAARLLLGLRSFRWDCGLAWTGFSFGFDVAEAFTDSGTSVRRTEIAGVEAAPFSFGFVGACTDGFFTDAFEAVLTERSFGGAVHA
jgi:hypothetical protein